MSFVAPEITAIEVKFLNPVTNKNKTVYLIKSTTFSEAAEQIESSFSFNDIKPVILRMTAITKS